MVSIFQLKIRNGIPTTNQHVTDLIQITLLVIHHVLGHLTYKAPSLRPDSIGRKRPVPQGQFSI